MRVNEWGRRVLATIARRTPAYRSVRVLFPAGSWPHRLAAVVARANPVYRLSQPRRRLAPEATALVYDLSQAVVAVHAPHELPVFPDVFRAYVADPRRVLAGSAAGGRLRYVSAGGQAVELLTPIAVDAVGAVVAFLLEAIAPSGEPPIGAVRHRLDVVPPQLTEEQRAEVRRIVAATVAESGSTDADELARRIADALLGAGSEGRDA